MVAIVALSVIIATFLYGTLVGWAIHWVLHQRWSGRLYRSHMNHHLQQYPPKDLLSTSYRSPGLDDGLIYFTPIILLSFVLFCGAMFLLGAPLWLLGVAAGEAMCISWLHNWVHGKLHIRDTVLLKLGWFRLLRILHFYHHRNMKKNLGILFFGWDRVFRTFRR